MSNNKPVLEELEEDVGSLHHDKHDHAMYNSEQIKDIQAVYIVALLVWIALLLVLSVVRDDYLLLLILLIPPVIFVFNFVSLGDFTCLLEDQMFRSNFLSFAFLVAIILINWNSPLGHHDKTGFFKILIVAFVLLMLSLLDIWVNQEHMSVVKHIKTTLHTGSLSLIALALYLYYVNHTTEYGFDLS